MVCRLIHLFYFSQEKFDSAVWSSRTPTGGADPIPASRVFTDARTPLDMGCDVPDGTVGLLVPASPSLPIMLHNCMYVSCVPS